MGGAVLGELVAALAKAQAEIRAPKKGRTANITSERTGKSHSYSYADLADVIECYRKPLSDNGLAITQTIRQREGHLILVTTLFHTSGQWIATEFPIKSYDRPQETGSAITYARRYSVTSLLGIAAEDDDDGQTAQNAQRAEPVNADAAAILLHAAEIVDLIGGKSEDHIKAASAFTNSKGEHVEGKMTDPRTVKPGKWLSMTRTNIAKRLQDAQLAGEPGAAEAADLFT